MTVHNLRPNARKARKFLEELPRRKEYPPEVWQQLYAEWGKRLTDAGFMAMVDWDSGAVMIAHQDHCCMGGPEPKPGQVQRMKGGMVFIDFGERGAGS